MKFIFYCLAFAGSFQFAGAQKNKLLDVQAITSARNASNSAIAAHDIYNLSKYWLDDFVQVRGSSTHLVGKDKIIASWKELFATNKEVWYSRNPTEIIISENDTLAWETGKWIASHSYSKGGNYSAMWKKVNGEWKIKAELFVSLYD